MTLRAQSLNTQIERAEDILERAIDKHDPVQVFAMFSGGDDSLASTHFVMERVPDAEVLHINTGIGIPQTREYVRETCDKYGWPLVEEKPQDVQYEDFVKEHGFPGPSAHLYAYVWLKERPLNNVVKRYKNDRLDEVLLCTGVRKSESDRRMGNVEPINKRGSKIWTAPITDWQRGDLEAYRERFDLERNPVAEMLHMSGECLCGAYAGPDEFEQIDFFFPDVADRIRRIEDMVEAEGHNRCRWGNRQKLGDDQAELTDFAPMCTGCEVKNRERREAEQDN